MGSDFRTDPTIRQGDMRRCGVIVQAAAAIGVIRIRSVSGRQEQLSRTAARRRGYLGGHLAQASFAEPGDVTVIVRFRCQAGLRRRKFRGWWLTVD
jgi:hypothetical protein